MNTLVNAKLHDKPIDAATVILLRDQNNELQTLLLCRANSRTVMNNAWVFPGGKVDSEDLQHAANIQGELSAPATDLLNEPDLDKPLANALFYTACRETQEETGVTLQPAQLQTWSRWVTPNEPSMMKKRFDARFFVAALPHGQTAAHDGTEATDSQWITPGKALQHYQELKIVLAPPQIMSLIALSTFTNVAECLKHASQTPAYSIKPQVIKTDDSRTLIYPGDPEHSETIQQMPGPTRLIWHKDHFEPPGGFTT